MTQQTTQTTHKRVDELQPGDRVIVKQTNTAVRITNVSRGFWRNSKLIDWTGGGWACMNDSDLVEVAQ